MPGLHVEKIPLMANAACQKVWNRDFNKDHPDDDRLTTYGGWMNPKCFLLIDNGPVNGLYTLVKLRWDGEKLVDDLGPLHPRIRKELESKYQFNPEDRPETNGLTDQELKDVLKAEECDRVIKSRNEMTARHHAMMYKQT
ncbi:uncharacterized protein RSE6_14257 [Rhynchosporium secalis]|uniref:Uncharacterized protein n=1 Tax=Rhynchosporium secalis TaxID=38038 RepID=A0A1E1MUX0_RHYSE|nr:uncharacterized protein RSE6_14257 [Rhynchosporium secalis]